MDFDDPELERIMKAWGEASRSGRYSKCEALMGALRRWLAEHVEDNPEFNCSWFEVALQCEENGDWEGAEAAYREIVALKGNDWKALSDLSGFFDMLGRKDEAIDYARRATEVARGNGIDVLLATALRWEAAMYLEMCDLAAAEMLVAEMFEVLERDSHHSFFLGKRWSYVNGHEKAQRDTKEI